MALTTSEAAELAALRQDTANLIREEGQDIALIRDAGPVSDGVGGRKAHANASDDVPITAKRRFFALTESNPVDATTVIGEEIVTKFVLIGTYNDDIRRGDIIKLYGQEFKVEFVNPDRRYQTKAWGRSIGNG